MKRIKIVALCVMVAGAFAAISGVSSASAAEFGSCVAKKKSKYTDANCTTLSAKPGKGHFEFEPAGVCYENKKSEYSDNTCTTKSAKAHKGHFELSPLVKSSVVGGTGELRSELGVIKCTSSSGEQQITGPKTLVAQTIFHGCETKGHPCENVGPGTIATFPLNGALTEPSAGKASVKLTGTGSDGLGGANEGKYLAEFGCETVAAIRVHGELGDNVVPVNVQGTSEESQFVEGLEQKLVAEFGPPGFGTGTVTVASEQIGTVTATSATAGEIHAP